MRGPGRTPETTTASMSTMSSGVGAAAGDASRVTGIGATLACGSSADCACVGSTTRHATRTTVRQLERMVAHRSEEHTSELQSLMRISYAVFCLKKKKKHKQ